MRDTFSLGRHNVSDPPVRRYHQPGVGGVFAARFVSVSATQSGAYLAWHGYDADAGADRIWCQFHGPQGACELECLTATPGDHMRPAISAVSAEHADVVWITDQDRLCHAVCRRGARHEVREIESSGAWLRDVTLHRAGQSVWCAVIESRGDRDTLRILALDDDGWRPVVRYATEGFAARPSLAVDSQGHLHAAVESYEAGKYRLVTIVVEQGEVTSIRRVEAADASCTMPRLTTAADGSVWMSFIREMVVSRDGVVSRAAWIDVARFEGGQWVIEQGLAPLHLGWLPRRRYFGYSGLRRNPRLVATVDGAVHLVWEQARDEEEVWANVWNGRLLGRTWVAGRWRPTRRWHEGGCCFALDHRVIPEADGVPVAVKGEHRAAGDDFRVLYVNPAEADDAPDEAIEQGRGWHTYTPPARLRRPAIELDGQSLQLFFGDFHNHSVCSPDAEGHPDELYHFARDVAQVDFAGITDNDFYPEKALLLSESAYQRRLVRRLEQPGVFVPFTGYEWTFHRDDGRDSYNHRSIIFLDDEQRIARRIDRSARDEDACRRTLAGMNVFAHAHHGQYDLLGIDQEANVEITSGWAINMEISQAAHEHLSHGRRFGFIGGSDGHRAVPGLGGALVAVWATDLTRDAIVDALRARRCYATTGNRMMIDFRVSGAFIGQVCPWDGRTPITCAIRVESPVPLRNVQIIRNGVVVHTIQTDQARLNAAWTDPDPPSSGAWYYLRVENQTPYREHPHNVCQAVGHLAWSSPVWITRQDRSSR